MQNRPRQVYKTGPSPLWVLGEDWVLGEGASLFTGAAQKMEPQEVKREVGKGWGWEGVVLGGSVL